jgi:hypothetical protein
MFRTIAVLLLLSSTAYCGPTYDKTAHVFISRATSDGYHVGDSVCYSTSRAVNCYPDSPQTDYRFEFPNGEFATVRFIAASYDSLDAVALILERKDKDTTVHYRLLDKVTDFSKAYTIGVSYSDKDEHGRTVEKESKYRVYPDPQH